MNERIMLVVENESSESSKYNLYRLNNTSEVDEIVKEYSGNKSTNGLNEDGIKFRVFKNYDDVFDTYEEKHDFKEVIEHITTNNHCIGEETIFIWNYESAFIASIGGWYWSNDIDDIIDCYKHVILNRIFGFVYEGVMTMSEKELFGTNRLLQELIWHEDLEKTNKFGMIRDLLGELEKDKTFEKFEYVVDEVQKQCELLKIDCDVFALKGLRNAKRIVKAHGSLYDENNLFKTFNEDVIA
ncbi:MAG: hypothetical protein IKJ30_01195 [Bacilli bacterium]|nr:hypothetical protein [Bacilli bacterium]